MRRSVPIRDFKIRPALRGEVEAIHCLPPVIYLQLQLRRLAVAAEAVGAVWGRLFHAGFETERGGGTRSPKADIGNELPFGKLNQGQSMRERCRLPFVTGPKDPPAKGDNRKSQSGQHVVKEGIVFLAIPPASAPDELCHNRRGIEVDGMAEEGVQVLER